MAGTLLECRLEDLPSALVLHVRGEVDLWTSEQVREHLISTLRGGRPVVIDMRQVSYLDGAGFRVLAECTRGSPGGRPPICVLPSPMVRRLLTLLRLDDAFPVRDSLEDALGAVGVSAQRAD